MGGKSRRSCTSPIERTAPARIGARAVRFVSMLALVLAVGCQEPPTGHPGFASPHAAPIALSPTSAELYVVNTPADTLDIIDTKTRRVVRRVPVGIDPVSVAVRPDGREVWVSNHVSDTVSIVDADPASATRHHVVATVTAWDEDGWVTDFDEPVGIAFASDDKAYVALSSRNRIAVVDVPSRTVTGQIQIKAQEPRAIAVRGGRLYVIPFESGNRTELSGCLNPVGECTFHLLELVTNSIDVILTRNLVADIVRSRHAPDRDLFVFDTADESPLFEVSTLGTLLYGLTVDSAGRVFIAMTEARNDANGDSGTQLHDLVEMENRAFLNQVVRVDCAVDCSDQLLIDLEPLPPLHPAPGTQLATPFGIEVSADDATVVAVAAGSSRLFTLDAESGQILGMVDVGPIPRGLALDSSSDGSPERAWVLNAVDNSVSLVDVSDPRHPDQTHRIALDDPTHGQVKRGRIAFNDALGSTTGTFACASCHPDGNTDQLLWNLGAKCSTPGCNQAQPRSTMPVRGLRDTLPLHWDGVPGDPFGGVNGEVADSGEVVEPNCTDEHSCFRDLVDGSMSGTMCDQEACPIDENERGLAGAFGEADRDAMAVFLRSVPYPPARSRRLDDRFSPLGAEGFRNFLIGIDDDHPGCSRAGACHSLPFWAGTNTPGTGFDAPTFRGMTDRHLLLPNGRAAMWPLLSIATLNEVPWNPHDGPDELYAWGMTFGTEAVPITNRNSAGTGPFQLFQLFEEGSTGFSAAFGRQVTLDVTTTAPPNDPATLALLRRLEEADADGVVDLRASGTRLSDEADACGGGSPLCSPVFSEIMDRIGAGGSEADVRRDDLRLVYDDGRYRPAGGVPIDPMTSDALVAAARAGELVVTVTARLGPHSDVEHPQPALWLPSRNPARRTALQLIPELVGTPSLTLFGRHVAPGAIVLIDGRAVEGDVHCELGGALPACDDELLRVDLAALPAAGDRTLQVVTPGGLLSNEVLVIVR